MSRNRLGTETSPYLLQHKNNPVHWWAWGPEALAEAAATDRPILLSIGYAACHWCHVMAHESFEDDATAALMNDLYVCIKVDREERPDIDALYMSALHTLGEQGGWPLTMFLTPQGEPFYGGTYFPPEDRFGRPSFRRVLSEIARVYREDRERVTTASTAILERLRASREIASPGASLSETGIRDLAMQLAKAMDPQRGGLKGAPKFPQFNVHWLLWRAGIRFGSTTCRDAVLVTLRNICQGGIYDHIGGGFSRYSVDERWLVPHFEKMLYDNALLMQLLLEAWRETGEPLFRDRIEETAEWLLREMLTAEGAFASSYDADSEGEEGRFYVWTPAQARDVLGEADASVFCRVYDITDTGNFEGRSIPNRLSDPGSLSADDELRLGNMRARLYDARRQRVPPGWDDKVLADWNGLTIGALAGAGVTLQRPEWIAAAKRALDFVLTTMMPDGRLRHAYRAGQLRGAATASDYADLVAGALALHRATGETDSLETAIRLADVLHRHYWIPDRGGYAFTADDTADVIVRTETAHDDATPNANAVMLSSLMALHALTGEPAYMQRAEALLRAYLPEIAEAPLGHCGHLAGALDVIAPVQVVIVVPVGSDGGPMRRALQSLSMPGATVQVVSEGASMPAGSPLHGKGAVAGKPTAYVCVAGTCSLPLTEPATFRTELLRARAATQA